MTDITLDPRVQAAAEAHPYPLVFATVSGAHLYGFASADSDVDLRGAHVTPLEEVVGLDPVPETVERSYLEGGLEIDLVTHDIRKFASLLLKRNGYVLEQLLSPLVVTSTPRFEELRSFAPGCVTRHHAHHYLGFAATQWELFAKDKPPRIKPLLYLYRVLLTGIHLMATGETEANLEHLLERRRDLGDVRELLGAKRMGSERATLADVDLDRHSQRYLALRAELERAYETSRLPDRPTARRDVDQLVIGTRLELGHAKVAP
jgi:predicted nucleotidyltransferase